MNMRKPYATDVNVNRCASISSCFESVPKVSSQGLRAARWHVRHLQQDTASNRLLSQQKNSAIDADIMGANRSMPL